MTKEEFWNLKVGEKFNVGYRRFEVKKGDGSSKDCKTCYFNSSINSCACLRAEYMLPRCKKFLRKDGVDIIFIEVEDEKN